MRAQRRQLAAWGVFGLTCLLVGLGGALSADGSRGQAQAADAVLALAFTATGALIVTRRRNPLGWLALLMSLAGGVWSLHSAGGTGTTVETRLPLLGAT